VLLKHASSTEKLCDEGGSIIISKLFGIWTEVDKRTVTRPRLEQTYRYTNPPDVIKWLREYSEYRLPLCLCTHGVKECIIKQEFWQHLIVIDLVLNADKKPQQQWK